MLIGVASLDDDFSDLGMEDDEVGPDMIHHGEEVGLTVYPPLSFF
jgi:hypothetical protein